jgi:hypothetical protein
VVRFPVGTRRLSLSESVETGSGTHPASYSIGTGDSRPGDKATGALKFTADLHGLPRLRISGAITPLSYMLSWLAQGQLYL